ncbi:hypothetical protein ACFSKY_10820 [Azotobacter chroococcum]|jgi:hypothetical protein|uniref:hypothetical protein n=1 Tax=Azotobacter chroococcum TaxID=353 RepID=UPI0010D0F934|nr:hypothetical protein E0E53_09435 [Azotobacter chroococcum]
MSNAILAIIPEFPNASCANHPCGFTLPVNSRRHPCRSMRLLRDLPITCHPGGGLRRLPCFSVRFLRDVLEQ